MSVFYYYCFFQRTFILKNAQYILETLMAKIEQMYKNQQIPFPNQLTSVNNEYRRLKTVASKSSN